MIENAKHYLDAGLSVLPAKRQDKRPCVGSWKPYQKHLPTQMEIEAWFSNPQDGLCIITGAVSGNLEIIDFDNGGELFDACGGGVVGGVWAEDAYVFDGIGGGLAEEVGGQVGDH